MTSVEVGEPTQASAALGDAIVVLDSSTNRFVFGNQRALELFGCQRERLLASSPLDFSPALQPDGRATPQSCLEQLRTARTRGSHTFPWLHCDTRGREFLCEVRLVQLQHEGGRLYEGTIRPQPSRVPSDSIAEPPAEAFTPYREIVEALPYVVWVRDAEGRMLYVSDYWLSYSGQSRAEAFRPGSWVDVVHPDDQMHTVATFRDALAKGIAFDCQHRVRYAATGEYRWFHSRAVCERDAQGKPLRWLGSAMDIEDFKRMQEALRRAEQRGHESLAVLAHELRSPLAALTASLDQLQSTVPALADDCSAMSTVQRQLGHLRQIIDDVLEISRLERGKQRLRSMPLDLAAVVRDTLDDCGPALAAADLELFAELPISRVSLVGDASRLTQILTNLLENARKFTPRGGWVRVSLVADGTAREAVLAVTDSGAGIEPALLGAVFEPFQQAEHAAVRGAGLGLGLAIVHRLVELHGGRVSAHSAGRNRGTTITVRLPMALEPNATP